MPYIVLEVPRNLKRGFALKPKDSRFLYEVAPIACSSSTARALRDPSDTRSAAVLWIALDTWREGLSAVPWEIRLSGAVGIKAIGNIVANGIKLLVFIFPD